MSNCALIAATIQLSEEAPPSVVDSILTANRIGPGRCGGVGVQPCGFTSAGKGATWVDGKELICERFCGGSEMLFCDKSNSLMSFATPCERRRRHEKAHGDRQR